MYYEYSIKSITTITITREKRNIAQSSKSVKVTLKFNGPAQERNVVLTNKNNVVQETVDWTTG